MYHSCWTHELYPLNLFNICKAGSSVNWDGQLCSCREEEGRGPFLLLLFFFQLVETCKTLFCWEWEMEKRDQVEERERTLGTGGKITWVFYEVAAPLSSLPVQPKSRHIFPKGAILKWTIIECELCLSTVYQITLISMAPMAAVLTTLCLRRWGSTRPQR